MSSSGVKPEKLFISLDEIRSQERLVGYGGFGRVYRGQLSERWQNRTAAFKRFDDNVKEEYSLISVEMMPNFHHKNIIPFIGYCDEANEMIAVFEYASNGSVDSHLHDHDKKRYLTWAQRLKICIGIARGLEHLHSGLEDNKKVIHGDMKSSNILLDENLEAKVIDFDLSVIVDRNQPPIYKGAVGTKLYNGRKNKNRTYLLTNGIGGTECYWDPIFKESGVLSTESDVYSFGMILFEMLTGMLAHVERVIGDDAQPQRLINLVRHNYYDDGPYMLIDPLISDQINIHSFHVFAKIAYQCISYNLKDRPTMKRIIRRIEEALEIQKMNNMPHGETSPVLTRSHHHQDLERFRIQLKDINYVADKEHRIGDGGFGKVYQGKLSQLPNCIVAIKCLDPTGLQGKKEFLTEVELISSFHHPNIIPFVGYCDEGEQMIMVSEYAINGSLDHHLSDPIREKRLTWPQRLKICLGAAKGLDYLHSGPGKGRVIHRDVKSGNILLDKNQEAKLCDFGLSKQGPINQHTQIYTKAAGTIFYLDPVYHESGILSKESDVYSFGVVLFEMLCGTLAYNPTTFVDGSLQYLIILVRRYCINEPKKLIDPDIRDEIDSQCFETFKEVAYQCINLKSEERPTMDTIIDRLEDAIGFQELKVKRDAKDL